MNTMFDWSGIFSTARIITVDDSIVRQKVTCHSSKSIGDYRSPFERDYGRVVYSSLFRRLAGKTQILPETGIDHVRNRLTHSIEVSNIAGSILREVDRILVAKRGLRLHRLDDAYWVVRTAGLAHDIGNPPYGHAGEKAIREWGERYFKKHPEFRMVAADFVHFDGNAQSFRLLSRNDLGVSDDVCLTATSLAAIVKYPYSVGDRRARGGKFNAFKTEVDILDAVMSQMNLGDTNGYFRRHPLSFVLEAADDTSYNLSDLEDAVYMGIITQEVKNGLFQELLQRNSKPRKISMSRSAMQSAVATVLIKGYAQAFVNSMEDVFTNRLFDGHALEAALPKNIREWLSEVDAIREQIVSDLSVKGAEESGARLIKKMLDEMAKIVSYVGQGEDSKPEKRVLTLVKQTFGEEFFRVNRDRPKEWWLHAILDYVSGMTDAYLQKLGRSGASRG